MEQSKAIPRNKRTFFEFFQNKAIDNNVRNCEAGEKNLKNRPDLQP